MPAEQAKPVRLLLASPYRSQAWRWLKVSAQDSGVRVCPAAARVPLSLDIGGATYSEVLTPLLLALTLIKPVKYHSIYGKE